MRCGYFNVLEGIERCGPNGYPLSVGLKLCQELTSYTQTFNEEVSDMNDRLL